MCFRCLQACCEVVRRQFREVTGGPQNSGFHECCVHVHPVPFCVHLKESKMTQVKIVHVHVHVYVHVHVHVPLHVRHASNPHTPLLCHQHLAKFIPRLSETSQRLACLGKNRHTRAIGKLLYAERSVVLGIPSHVLLVPGDVSVRACKMPHSWRHYFFAL